jgi:hypothetical protein
MLTDKPATSRDGRPGGPCPIFDLPVTRRGGVQPAITLRRNGWVTASGMCLFLLRLDPPGLGRTQAVPGDYAATGTPWSTATLPVIRTVGSTPDSVRYLSVNPVTGPAYSPRPHLRLAVHASVFGLPFSASGRPGRK